MQLFILFLLVVIGVIVTRKPKHPDNVLQIKNSVARFKHTIKFADYSELKFFLAWKTEIIERAKKTTDIADWVEQELESAFAKRREQLNNFYNRIEVSAN